MNILIADDHHLIIEGFTEILKKEIPEACVFTASNLDELQEVLSENKIEILFQDIRLGQHDAREFIFPIIQQYAELNVIVITSINDNTSIDSLFKMGIKGYLLKYDQKEEVANAINTVLHGDIYTSPEIVALKKGERIDLEKKIFLTPRETEVLQLIIRGSTTKEISEKISLSEKTIETHRMNLFLKFDIKNVAGLVRKAILEGFL